jgi:hypothetical protein
VISLTSLYHYTLSFNANLLLSFCLLMPISYYFNVFLTTIILLLCYCLFMLIFYPYTIITMLLSFYAYLLCHMSYVIYLYVVCHISFTVFLWCSLRRRRRWEADYIHRPLQVCIYVYTSSARYLLSFNANLLLSFCLLMPIS